MSFIRGERLPRNPPENRRLYVWSENGVGADQANSTIPYLEPWRRRADSNRRIEVLSPPTFGNVVIYTLTVDSRRTTCTPDDTSLRLQSVGITVGINH